VVVKLRAVTAAVVLGLVCITLITGCSRERIDWKSAEAADTQEGYNHFLERHPDSEFATQARARLAQLAEDKDWQRAIAADTAEAYRSFLAQHATGKWAEEARIRMENFTLDSAAPSTAPDLASSTPAESKTPSSPPAPATTSAAQSLPKNSPSSAPAPVAHTKPPENSTSADDASRYGIQLGAFSSQAAALNEWKRLQVKFDAQLHGMFARAIPVQVTSGTLFRLQSPTANEAKAREICGALTKQQQPCVVVLPTSH
jgi:cell division protein FtsN